MVIYRCEVLSWIYCCLTEFFLQKLMLQPGAVSTKVLCLTQVVSPEELINDEDYEDIMEDMRGEGEKFGKLIHCLNVYITP